MAVVMSGQKWLGGDESASERFCDLFERGRRRGRGGVLSCVVRSVLDVLHCKMAKHKRLPDDASENTMAYGFDSRVAC